MIKFNDEFLGKIVKKPQMFCSIGLEPITDYTQLRFAAGGNKFSSLCGFIFDCAEPKIEFPRYMIAFVSKLRSSIYRQQQRNPSQWFIFRRINKNRVDVLDKKVLSIGYGFDIDKFFDSDLFKYGVSKFEATLNKGLADAEKFVATVDDDKIRKECNRYILAIRDAIPIMKVSKRVNNSFYSLYDLDRIEKAATAGISDEVKKKALDSKLKDIHNAVKDTMSSAARYAKTHDKSAENNESEEINEKRNADDFKCKVVKSKEDGNDVYEVIEINTGAWVATFDNELMAKKFAEDEYPKIKAEYLDNSDKIASQFEVEEQVEETEEQRKEKELNDNIEEALKEIYG